MTPWRSFEISWRFAAHHAERLAANRWSLQHSDHEEVTNHSAHWTPLRGHSVFFFVSCYMDEKNQWPSTNKKITEHKKNIKKIKKKHPQLYQPAPPCDDSASQLDVLMINHEALRCLASRCFTSLGPTFRKECEEKSLTFLGKSPSSYYLRQEPLLREMKLCSIAVRFKLKLLIHTYRCTHALASSLLCQQYKLRSPSNSTHSTTRSQLTLLLCIPSAARHPGTISPLFTSTLLWNSLPSPIRSASLLHTFRQDLQKYLGTPVRPR